MAVEGREQVTRIGIVRVNGQPEELDGPDGRRQPSLGGTSRVSREAQARICERLGVKFPGATHLVVLCRWKPPETYMPKLRQFLARLRVTVNEDKTRIVDCTGWLRLSGGALSETTFAARCQPVVLLLLAVATVDATDSGQGESGNRPRQPPVGAREVGPTEPDTAGMVGLLRLAQLSPAFSEGRSIRHVETSALVAD